MSTKLPSTYKSLFQKVKQTLILGQQRIEAEKVKVYWETGRLIHAHVIKYADRAEYGAQVLKELADDLNVEIRLLQRCVRFAKTYSRPPIAAGRPQFSWSHYRELIKIEDDQLRLSLEDKAGKNAWSSEELAVRIKAGKGSPAAVEKETPAPKTLLTPARGQLYTYRFVSRPNLGGPVSDRPLLLDLGFGMYKRISARTQARFLAEQIVESEYDAKEETYALSASKRTFKDLLLIRP